MAIYRKGEFQSGLEQRALQQRLEESAARRSMGQGAAFERDVTTGVAGAKNVVNLNPTVAEATANPDMLGGPVSGDAMAKEKRMKREKRATAEKESKRVRKAGK